MWLRGNWGKGFAGIENHLKSWTDELMATG
jgi:hypothetical protein